jgi:DNA-binding NtrC family response regulator
MKKGNILLVDDNHNVITALSRLLEPEFNQVVAINDPDLIPGILELKSIDAILMDMNFKPGDSSGVEGLTWLRRILKIDADSVVIMMTAFGEVELAVRAIKSGANDFILKPWDNDKLIATLKSGLQLRESRDTVRKLKNKQVHLNREISDKQYKLIGDSDPMQSVKKIISKIAATDSSILILGENGTGKELIAREIHRQSDRSDEVFVHVDMGAISDTLFESELFGHTKGAFTDAAQDRAGRFEIASGGTLFLDEIGNLSSNLQSKLLNVIQNREVYRLGSNKPTYVDIRIICATNQNMEELIRKNMFRKDLYYRINTIEIVSPPLRERGNDINLLADYFLEEFKKKHNKKDLFFSAAFRQELLKQDWPGNVRQLRNHIEKAVLLSESSKINPEEFLRSKYPGKNSLKQETSLSSIQKEILLDMLIKNNWNISKTADELDVARSTIYNKLKKYGIQNQ